jgi:mono/diheme cytochrome c family protein
MRSNQFRWVVVAGVISGLLLACSDADPKPSPPSAGGTPATSPAPAPPSPSDPLLPSVTPAAAVEQTLDPAALVARGKTVYMTNCIICHNLVPTLDGALGPAIAGSSRELVEARVMRVEYPEGYTPKRETRVMVALPHLERELDALAAFLAK